MAKVRKRRPGGGRKPQGDIRGKSKTFSTRITGETREALETEADVSGRSISQVAESLLVLGLNTKREIERDAAMRALCFVIAELAHHVVGVHIFGKDGKEQPAASWRTTRFFFRAFKIAVGKVLDALEPAGEIETVDYSAINLPGAEDLAREWKSTFKSPEARGAYAAGYVLHSLYSSPHQTPAERESTRQVLTKFDSKSFWREFNSMPNASRALGLDNNTYGTMRVMRARGRLPVKPA